MSCVTDVSISRVWRLVVEEYDAKHDRFKVHLETLDGRVYCKKNGNVAVMTTDAAHRLLYSTIEGPIVTLFRWNMYITQPELVPDELLKSHRWILLKRNVRRGPLRYDRWFCPHCHELRETAPGLDDPGGLCLFTVDLLAFQYFGLTDESR